MLIDINEVKTMIKEHLPSFASNHKGVQLLIKFVGKTVNAVNNLHGRLVKVEEALNIKSDTDSSAPKSE